MKPVQKRTRRPLRGLIGVVATIVVSGLLMFGFPSNPLKVQYPPKVTTPAPAKSGVAAATFKQKSIPVLPMADPFATAPSLPAIALAPATTVIPAPVSPVLQVKTKLPAVAAIQTGTLAVSSPTTVDIYMGDQFVGSAPATLELQAGSQTIEYRHKGMKKVVTHFIRPNEMTTAMVTFDVPVQINAKPWAQVFLDVSGTFHGHDGYLKVWRGVLESFEDVRLDPEELLDFGDRFLVTIKVSAHGAGSGASTSQSQFQVFTMRRGLVIRQDDFQDHAEALEAVGLSE